MNVEWIPTAIAVSALIVALCNWWLVRQGHQHRGLNRRMRTLEADVANMDDVLTKNQKLLKTVNARTLMQQRRAKEQEEEQQSDDFPDPASEPDRWRREIGKRFLKGG